MLEKIGLPAKPSMRGANWVIDASHCQGPPPSMEEGRWPPLDGRRPPSASVSVDGRHQSTTGSLLGSRSNLLTSPPAFRDGEAGLNFDSKNIFSWDKEGPRDVKRKSTDMLLEESPNYDTKHATLNDSVELKNDQLKIISSLQKY
ncbi:hypothetical protein M5K25_020059 [Dendrobium thyrsiflorum]|uniref:Uncharacterized protein n=1 Tax=Dendrobium thyrsiflorum TaxID=117978 RepID=A0ABD0U8X1_DENTH